MIASEIIKENGLAELILIGNKDRIKAKCEELGVNIEGIEIVDPETSEKTDEFAKAFYELRKHKGMTEEKADRIVRDPLYFGTMMVKMGDAEGMVSGAIHTTGDLLRPGMQIIKTAPGIKVVSSFFIMQIT